VHCCHLEVVEDGAGDVDNEDSDDESATTHVGVVTTSAVDSHIVTNDQPGTTQNAT
jgi:hypothetical protein